MTRKNQTSFVEISVEDSGVGISKDDQKRLFKLFGFLSHSKKINTRGVGLSLAIAKMITEEFGGEITVDSTIGMGSTFSFKF